MGNAGRQKVGEIGNLRYIRSVEGILCGVHPAGHGRQGAENNICLLSRWAIVGRNGGWGRGSVVDGQNEDEMGEKRVYGIHLRDKVGSERTESIRG